jgi:hypothetical protein
MTWAGGTVGPRTVPLAMDVMPMREGDCLRRHIQGLLWTTFDPGSRRRSCISSGRTPERGPALHRDFGDQKSMSSPAGVAPEDSLSSEAGSSARCASKAALYSRYSSRSPLISSLNVLSVASFEEVNVVSFS